MKKKGYSRQFKNIDEARGEGVLVVVLQRKGARGLGAFSYFSQFGYTMYRVEPERSWAGWLEVRERLQRPPRPLGKPPRSRRNASTPKVANPTPYRRKGKCIELCKWVRVGQPRRERILPASSLAPTTVHPRGTYTNDTRLY